MTREGSDVDALYQLPLDEFTAARNNLAATLKTGGRAEEAARVKGLAKPPVSAWAVNQLYWRHRPQFDELMAAGDQLRTAQASQLRGKGGELHAPLEARSAALSKLTQRAAALLRDSGHTPSPDLMRRIMTTLEALAAYGSRVSASTAGRLSDDMDAPGFEALAGLVQGKDGGAKQGRRVLPFTSKHERVASKKLSSEERKAREAAERTARLAAATTAVREGEQALAEAQKAAERAEASLKKAAAKARETKKEQDALSARMEKVTAEADQARREAHRSASEAEEAAQAVADAERSLDEARKNYKSIN